MGQFAGERHFAAIGRDRRPAATQVDSNLIRLIVTQAFGGGPWSMARQQGRQDRQGHFRHGLRRRGLTPRRIGRIRQTSRPAGPRDRQPNGGCAGIRIRSTSERCAGAPLVVRTAPVIDAEQQANPTELPRCRRTLNRATAPASIWETVSSQTEHITNSPVDSRFCASCRGLCVHALVISASACRDNPGGSVSWGDAP